MKIVFTLLVLFLSVNVHCQLITDKDQITGIESKSTKFEEVGRLPKYGYIKFKLSQNKSSDSTFRLYIQISRKKTKCISIDSKILISTDSGIVSLKLIGKIRSDTPYADYGVVSGLICCGRDLEGYADISLDQISILKKYKMNSIRVNYPDEYDDFQVIYDYRDQYEYFIRTLKWFK